LSGWSLAIIGDMAYFGLVMASTLWVSSLFGDDRLTIGAVLLATWLVPMLIGRMRRSAPQTAPRPGSLRVATAVAAPAVADTEPSRLPRKSVTHSGRRRRSTRGLHH
jgi:hypothetical protein